MGLARGGREGGSVYVCVWWGDAGGGGGGGPRTDGKRKADKDKDNR